MLNFTEIKERNNNIRAFKKKIGVDRQMELFNSFLSITLFLLDFM